MSSCSAIREILAKHTVGLADEALVKAAALHLESCVECRNYAQELAGYMKYTSLHCAADNDTNPEAFDSALHLKLASAKQYSTVSEPSGWLRRFIRPVTAVCVAAALFLIFGFFFVHRAVETEKEEAGTIISETEVESQKPVKITMEYVAARALNGVTVTFTLGEGVAFDSEDPAISGLNTWTWTGNFTEGKNEIPFIVNVAKLGKTKVETEARYGGFVHRHRIELDATGKMVRITYIELPKTQIITKG